MVKETKNNNDVLDLQYFVALFLKNWVFISTCLLVALVIAYGINKFSSRVYQVETLITIHETGKGLGNASAQLMQDIGFIQSSKKFANEMLELKSSPLIESAIKKLNFDISYYESSNFKMEEIYKSCPFIVIYNREMPQIVNCVYEVEIKEDGTYKISISEEDIPVYSFVSDEFISYLPKYTYEKDNVHFGRTLANDNFEFRLLVDRNFNVENLSVRKYYFMIHPPDYLIKDYQEALEINPPDLESTVASITMKTAVPAKDIDFLNSLTEAYLNKDIEQKVQTYRKTVEYIDKQLSEVEKSLDVAEDDLQNFRSNKQIVNISYQAEQIYDELNLMKNEKAKLKVNEKYVDYIIDYFEENELYSDLITPSAMGIDDPTLNNLVDELIKLNAEKSSFIENNQEKSPYLNKINVRIDNLRNLIVENIKYIKKTTNITLDDINSRISQLNKEISKMPETERQLTGIERIFNINDAIYTYLLEKKSEAEIAEASYQPDAEVMQPANIKGYGPVSPKKKMNYIFALFLGIIIPVSLIRIRDLVESTIREESDFSKYTNLPILGTVYHNNKKTEDVINNFPNSHITESFRKLRLNLKYFLKSLTGNIIVVSSSISSEGKSFIAFNLATIIANYSSKVVLVGFDLRKPRKYDIGDFKENMGISRFLSNQANMEDIIQKTKNPNLDVIIAGETPPNPSELIATERTDEMLVNLKENYDYIIIDTAPIGPVTDAYILMDKADLVVFSSRIKRTPKQLFKNLTSELQSRKYKTSVVINDIPISGKSRYGYGYYQK